MKHILYTILAVLIAGAPLSSARAEETTGPAASPAPEHDKDKARAEQREHIRAVLKGEGKMSDAEVKELEPDIDHFASRGGHGETVSTAVHEALARGCKGTCLANVLRDINRDMDRGRSEKAAEKAAVAKLHRKSGSTPEEQKESQRAQAREHERETGREHGMAGQGHGMH